MPIEDGLDSGPTVIDLDNLPGEGVEPRFPAGEPDVHIRFQTGESSFRAHEPAFHAGKSGLHARKASADGIHLQNSHNAHHNGEHRHKDHEIQLSDRGAKLDALGKGEHGFGVGSVRITPLNWAEGVPIGMSSAIYHTDTVELLNAGFRWSGIPSTARNPAITDFGAPSSERPK